MSTHLTSQELDATRAKYRGEIPVGDLLVMDAETEALRASGIERLALKPGATARTSCCPTHKAAVPDYNRSCAKVQSFSSFTEAAGAPIAICTCGAFNEP